VLPKTDGDRCYRDRKNYPKDDDVCEKIKDFQNEDDDRESQNGFISGN
jgi:hypothetical protein